MTTWWTSALLSKLHTVDITFPPWEKCHVVSCRLPDTPSHVPILKHLPPNSAALDVGAFAVDCQTVLESVEASPLHGSCLTPSQLVTPLHSPHTGRWQTSPPEMQQTDPLPELRLHLNIKRGQSGFSKLLWTVRSYRNCGISGTWEQGLNYLSLIFYNVSDNCHPERLTREFLSVLYLAIISWKLMAWNLNRNKNSSFNAINLEN